MRGFAAECLCALVKVHVKHIKRTGTFFFFLLVFMKLIVFIEDANKADLAAFVRKVFMSIINETQKQDNEIAINIRFLSSLAEVCITLPYLSCLPIPPSPPPLAPPSPLPLPSLTSSLVDSRNSGSGRIE